VAGSTADSPLPAATGGNIDSKVYPSAPHGFLNQLVPGMTPVVQGAWARE
jgi:hypothetical protein